MYPKPLLQTLNLLKTERRAREKTVTPQGEEVETNITKINKAVRSMGERKAGQRAVESQKEAVTRQQKDASHQVPRHRVHTNQNGRDNITHLSLQVKWSLQPNLPRRETVTGTTHQAIIRLFLNVIRMLTPGRIL